MKELKVNQPMYFGFSVFLVCIVLCGATTKLQERYSWKQLDFVFPNEISKQQALISGSYVPTNGLPVGIERWENKLFVTVPRWRDGEFS